MIALAKNGNKAAKDELLLGHISFFIFRINKVFYPILVKQHGEDILQECLLMAGEKIPLDGR